MTVAVYVENVDKVTTQLWSFTTQVMVNLKAAMLAVANRIAARERASLGAHSRTGRMAGSVKTKVQAWRDVSVSAVVTVGGGRRNGAPYAHLFERGFTGVESVKAHFRQPSGGGGPGLARVGELGVQMAGPVQRFSVRAFERNVKHKAHLYLNAAKEAERAATQVAVAEAVGTSIDKVGLR